MLNEWRNKVVLGDNKDLLKQLPDNSIECVVTDPPAGISFMNKEWDKDKGGKAEWIKWLTGVMSECLRVLKPGGHMVCWSLPRTSHWTASAIEDAGFEIRDCIQHLFSTGFPKSLDVSKAIDQKEGAERKVIGKRKHTSQDMRGNAYEAEIAKSRERVSCPITAPATEEAKQFDGYGTALKPAAELWWLCRKPILENTIAENVLKYGTGALNIGGCRIGTGNDKIEGGCKGRTALHGGGITDRAQVDQTTGRFPSNVLFSHLPSCKVVGVKKVKGTKPHQVFSKVEKYEGWGNITKKQGEVVNKYEDDEGNETIEDYECAEGCPVKQLNDQVGIKKSGFMKQSQKRSQDGGYHGGFPQDRIGDRDTYGDEGFVSRFYYCSKPSQFERNIGLIGTTKKVNDGRQTPIDNPFQRGETERLNVHPCLCPNSLVVTDKGLKKIYKICLGDKVYTEHGKFNEVYNKTYHHYNEYCYKIWVHGTNFSVTVTHNHPFLILRPTRKINEITNKSVFWSNAENMVVGDYTLTPILSEKEKFYKNYNKNFWFMAGFWLAEGSIMNPCRSKTTYAIFTIHEKEAEFVLGKLSTFINKKKIKVYKRKDCKAKGVYVSDTAYADEMVHLCGRGSRTKTINPLIYSIPKRLRKEFLLGYLYGDGCKIRGDYRCVTTSFNLAYQLKIIANSVGLCANFYKYDNKNREIKIGNRVIRGGIEYRLQFHTKNINMINRNPTKPTVVLYNNTRYLLSYVKKISKIRYTGNVVNISVKNSPTFQTVCGMSHNTVKSTMLMRYLVKLLRPPKRGIVLDPFMGSGSTGMAAILEDMDFIGFEQVSEYKEIADQRIRFVQDNKDLILKEGLKPEIVKKVKKTESNGLDKVFG